MGKEPSPVLENRFRTLHPAPGTGDMRRRVVVGIGRRGLSRATARSGGVDRVALM